MSNLERVESNIRTQLGLLPFTTPDCSASETLARLEFAKTPTRLSAVIGGGTGAMDYVADRAGKGWKVLVFERDVLGGRLHSVATEKPFLPKFLERAFVTTARPQVNTYVPTQVIYEGTGNGINLSQLTAKIDFDEIMFATGTIEKSTKLLVGEPDIKEFANYISAYDFTRSYNKTILSGGRPSELRTGYNDNGEKIYLNGAGLVAGEDMTRKLQACEIDYMFERNDFDPRSIAGFSYEKFTSQPLKTLAALYKDNERVREIMGTDVDFGNTDSILAKLQELGCKPIVMLYRKSEKALLNDKPSIPLSQLPVGQSPDTRIKAASFRQFQETAGFSLIEKREPAKIIKTNQDNQIEELQLLEGDYPDGARKRQSYNLAQIVKPVVFIDALGGDSPTISIDGNPLDTKIPAVINGTTYGIIGSAVDGQGNEKASRTLTQKMIHTLDTQYMPMRGIASETTWKEMLGYLGEIGLVPANTIAHTISQLTDYQIEKWGWA